MKCILICLFCLAALFPQAWLVHSLFLQDLAAEILVQTGHSVDYSLAISLLSLQWLSLLHHEIAWLSARLASVLCSNPSVHPPTTDPATLAKQTLPFPQPVQNKKRKKVHLDPLRSLSQNYSKTG